MNNFCGSCGNKINGNEKFCSKCGKPLKNNNDNKNKDTSMNLSNKKNTLSLIGFIFSIIGIITCGLTSIVGLILSIIAFTNSKKAKQKDGLALSGIIMSGIMVGIYVIGAFIVVITAKDVTVEDFSKKTYSESVEYCKNSELSCEVLEEYSNTVEEGKFISQSEEAGKTIKSYESVKVIYSKGTEPVKEEKNTKNKKSNKSTNYKTLKAISNSKLKENFAKACSEISMDVSKIKNLEKQEDWNSGPRYTFSYAGETFILYALDNGDVSSITLANNLLDKIYLDGYESVNVKDFIFDSSTKNTLQVKAEDKIKEYIKYPSSAKFKWMEYGYARRYDIYQITGKFTAKNAFGVESNHDFVIEFRSSDGGYSVVYLNVNSEKYIGDGSQLKEIQRNEKVVQEQKAEGSIILKDGVLGTYGKKDKFDGEDYIRYYIPAGTYKVEALTKNAHFFVETIELHKEDGWDAATTIKDVKLSKVGDTDEITINSDQCISLVMYTQIKLTKK